MRTLKKLIFSILFLLPLVTACDEREFDIPLRPIPKSEWAKTKTMTPIRTLLNNYNGKTQAITEDIYIRGTITANDVSGNIYNQIQIQDGTGGICIRVKPASKGALPIGQDIVVKCQGLFYGEYGSFPQLGSENAKQVDYLMLNIFEKYHCQKDGPIDVSKLKPKEVELKDLSLTVSSLTEQTKQLIGQLVTVSNVYFEKGGNGHFSDEVNVILKAVGTSNTLTARMSSYADFASELLPKGTGSVTGILTRFNNTVQILFRDYDDCHPDRFVNIGSGTKSDPYSIDFALANQAGDISGWVQGYIVGAVKAGVSTVSSNADINWAAPFEMDNTVLIAAGKEVKDYTKCLVVNLDAGTPIRSEVNLKNNAGNLGKLLKVEGTLQNHLGMAGLKTAGATANFVLEGDIIEPGKNLILNETFGTTAVQTGTAWPAVADYTGYSKTGAGAAQVTYTAEGGAVTVRNNSSSSGYSGASGACNALIAATGASLLVNNIATCGATALTLTFGSNETNSTLTVAYKINGTSQWVQIPYTKTTTSWELATATINLPAGTNTIKLKFTAVATQYGTRVDDINISTNDALGSPVIDPDTNNPPPPPPSAIFLETFGKSAPTANPRPSISEYTDYDNKAPVIFSGNTDVRATAGLNTAGYFSHIWFAAWSEQYPELKYLTISGINTAGATDLKLSFEMALNATSALTAKDLITVTVKDLNTSTETQLTIPATAFTKANEFSKVPDIAGVPATSNLEITLKCTQANTMGFRLDNVRIDGVKP